LSLISSFWHWDKSCNDFRNCAKLFLFMNSKDERVRQINSNSVKPIRFWESERFSFTKKFSSCYVKHRFIALFTEVPTWMQSKLYCFKVHSSINFPLTPPPTSLCLSYFSSKALCKCFTYFMHATYSTIFIFLDLTILSGEIAARRHFLFKNVNILKNKRSFLPNPYSSIIR